MSSSYVGNPAKATETLTLLTGGDRPTAQLFRVPLERLLDNDALRRQVAASDALQRLEDQVLTLRAVWRYSLTVTDTAESVGASASRDPTGTNPDSPVLICKTAQAFKLGDADLITSQGVPASITSLVTDAVHGLADLSRLLIIGTGGNRCSYSDDAGASWSAGGDIGATPKRLIWNGSVFMCTQGTDSVSRSSDGTSWTANGSASVILAGGLAAFANGNTVALGLLTGTVRFTSNDGATFASVANIPNAGSLDGFGCVAGNSGDTVYHVGSIDSGAQLQISSTSNTAGTGWAVIANIDAPPGDAFAAEPRLLMCRMTGVLVIVAPLAGAGAGSARSALYASVDGENWTRRRSVQTDPDPGVDGFALAGGKLIMTINEHLFASSGAGVG